MYSILDAMRVDLAGVQSGHYKDLKVTVPSDWSEPGDCTGASKGGDLTKANQNQWCDDLGSLLGPGTVGDIAADGGGNYTITITFNDERATGGSASQTMITRAKL